MARFGCYCGNTLSSVNCPSTDLLTLYRKEQVDEALRKDPKMTFWDFYTTVDYPDFEHWFCPECKRVYCVERKPISTAKTRFVYKPSDAPVRLGEEELSKCAEIYVFSDVEIYDETEPDLENKMLLSDFMKHHRRPYRYFIAPGGKWVYCVSQESGKETFAYELEKEL